jgi:NAD(P)-dependent dehydrogenase (short-subunit alcohol dehydrogenase family)
MKKNIFLITGTNSGIGYEITKKLLNDSQCFVIGVGRTESKIKSRNFKFIQFDLQSDNFYDLFKKINKITNYIDCFINNAGISSSGNKTADLEKTFKTNVFAGYKISKFFCKKNIRKKRKLNLIHIGSISGKIALPNNISYNSSKAALLMMSKSFALDYAKYNVRSNSIVLGYFPTNMTKSTFRNKKSRNEKIKRTMLGRLGKLEEIFETIKFLSSNKSSYITAQEITIDGGWTSKGL